MNFQEISENSIELVRSFANMEVDNRWEQFLDLQYQLAQNSISELIPMPEYIPLMLAGHMRINDRSFIRGLIASIEWPTEDLDQYLKSVAENRAASIAQSKMHVWAKLKENAPSHAAMAIFVNESYYSEPDVITFLNNLRS